MHRDFSDIYPFNTNNLHFPMLPILFHIIVRQNTLVSRGVKKNSEKTLSLFLEFSTRSQIKEEWSHRGKLAKLEYD